MKLEVDGTKEFLNKKQDKLNVESEQASIKIAQLKRLTKQYDHLYQKDMEIQAAYQDMSRQKQEVQSLLITKDEIMDAIVKEREGLKRDKLNVKKFEDKIRQMKNRCDMQCEDYRSYFLAQQEKLMDTENKIEVEKLFFMKKIEKQQRIIEENLTAKQEQAAIMEL